MGWMRHPGKCRSQSPLGTDSERLFEDSCPTGSHNLILGKDKSEVISRLAGPPFFQSSNHHPSVVKVVNHR